MKAVFDTTKYEWAHGSTPRGAGVWLFEFHKFDGSGSEVSGPVGGPRTYTDAKAWAVKHAKFIGAGVVEVCS